MYRRQGIIHNSFRELPGYVKKTKAPCMISLDDDPDTYRAEMPCGHTISPASLTEYCRTQLDTKEFLFRCPQLVNDQKCNYIWEYFIVKHLTNLSTVECQAFETRLAENYLNAANGIQQCPGCGTYCKRIDQTNSSVWCLECSTDEGCRYEFCWHCLCRWQKSRYDGDCGNAGCNNEDRRIRVLRECPFKMIEGVNCPSVRACPSCGVLINHVDRCKRMTCMIPTCKCSFCFICLKPAVNGSLQCVRNNGGNCTPAPIQAIR